MISGAARTGAVRRRTVCAALAGDLRGYNLLPYRAWLLGRIRQQRALGAACAALGGVGVAAVVAAAGGQDGVAASQQRQRLERELAVAAKPSVEHAKLQTELASYRAFCEQTAQRALRRDQLLSLFDRLSMAASHSVRLTELSRRSEETLISGRTASPHALSAWLNDVRRAKGVVSVSILSFRRAQPKRVASDRAEALPFDFTARLGHAGMPMQPREQKSATLQAAATRSIYAGESS